MQLFHSDPWTFLSDKLLHEQAEHGDRTNMVAASSGYPFRESNHLAMDNHHFTQVSQDRYMSRSACPPEYNRLINREPSMYLVSISSKYNTSIFDKVTNDFFTEPSSIEILQIKWQIPVEKCH
jgi:hypothetical protein